MTSQTKSLKIKSFFTFNFATTKIRVVTRLAEDSRGDPDYIHLCKCWSHICSGKKYRNTHFLLQIILFFSSADRKDWNVFGQGMPWLFCKICRMSLHACYAVKTVPEIFENSIIFKKIFKNSLIIPHVCFSNACRIQQNTRAEQITDYVARQLF